MKKLLASCCFALACASQANAQGFPSRPITLVIPFSAGGPADIIARTIAPKLQEELGQPIVVDNRAGGNGNIAHALVARAPADGHTLLYVAPGIVTNPSLFKAAQVDPFKELTPVAQLTTQSYVMIAHPSFKPRTLPELIAAADTGQVTCASGGGLPAFACDWLRSTTKKNITHVRYKGTQALNDLVGGHVNVMVDLFNTALPQVRAGTVRPIALTRATRGQPLPDVPVFAETLPGFVLQGWHGIMAPAGTAADRVERLNAAFTRALADPAVRQKITDSFIEVTPTSAAAFAETLKRDYEKYARIVKEAGIQPD
ncbi:tripartite tricarboxylate transporter substrate binding protein [Ramlibacter henchirensis]|uniref:Tripartite tricarboxylate transporter substrate binding protein n=1 Tax=Ramlibacter henchirensis TaxID=204072 RepID=A0A4Z0BTG7_9BURK|nr:tripartite tricarboxylate transporter substrate-binding protein [Ramlibacter henchirensis]TFZ02586.1 tripartite tricarboxylate transporter substrate binding protein [Ramlibacter henchirensis]